jgi:hypothetical protein
MVNRPVYVGLSGYARVGKDEAAKILTRAAFQIAKFSQPLKDAAYALDPQIVHNGITYSYAALIDAYGIERAKDLFPGVRRTQQRLGKAMRDVDEDVWVRAAFDRLGDGGAVFVDCRFPNEAEAIRSRGGIILRIERPGVGPAVGPDGEVHISEVALDGYDFDAVVVNDGSIDQLHTRVCLAVGGSLVAREEATQG